MDKDKMFEDDKKGKDDERKSKKESEKKEDSAKLPVPQDRRSRSVSPIRGTGKVVSKFFKSFIKPMEKSKKSDQISAAENEPSTSTGISRKTRIPEKQRKEYACQFIVAKDKSPTESELSRDTISSILSDDPPTPTEKTFSRRGSLKRASSFELPSEAFRKRRSISGSSPQPLVDLLTEDESQPVMNVTDEPPQEFLTNLKGIVHAFESLKETQSAENLPDEEMAPPSEPMEVLESDAGTESESLINMEEDTISYSPFEEKQVEDETPSDGKKPQEHKREPEST